MKCDFCNDGECCGEIGRLKEERDALRAQSKDDVAQLAAMCNEVVKLRAALEQSDKLIKALDKILAAYRLGGNPGNAPAEAMKAREMLKQMRHSKDL